MNGDSDSNPWQAPCKGSLKTLLSMVECNGMHACLCFHLQF